MAGKISTLVLKVDLECHRCYKKIRKTICQLQDRENIKTISYDEKNNTVTISGPFDPQKLSKKLRCKACKVIKDIQIIEIKEKPKDPPKDSKPAEPAPAEKEKPKPPKSEPEPKPKPKADAPPSEPAPKPKADPPAAKPDPPKTEPAQPKGEPKPPKPEPVTVGPVPGQPPVWPACCGAPYYEGYYGGCRCWSCGRVYGWVANGPPMAHGGPSYEGNKPCYFFCEEDPSTSCTIM
ncbi:protein PYRICULARIA ORYZAE RESISTANCE 21-like [Phoenix dactylifera]|uniref:Protein PYRICULARIA ORYZAE RESISTANCE 21-like n=1 Tax=Phoenix dactylifera TaxID=42345 RepID=A0A8B8J586_PHODC|nr:protein PYRICULARIA ORYZAE RESISTANCE 21-like [Phoenix dactylifera]XP_038983515.1 protein PYRICULARIA ORYZAE RESISTANCE 21-like [Phoenix dactylifera]